MPGINDKFLAGETPITANFLNRVVAKLNERLSIEGFDSLRVPEGLAFRRNRARQAAEVQSLAAYTGPWAMRVTGDLEITVGYSAEYAAANAPAVKDHVYFGQIRFELPEARVVTLPEFYSSQTGWIVADLRMYHNFFPPWQTPELEVTIQVEESALHLSGLQYPLSPLATYPTYNGLTMDSDAMDVSHRYRVVIGQWVSNAGKILSIQQYQYGPIRFGSKPQWLFYSEDERRLWARVYIDPTSREGGPYWDATVEVPVSTDSVVGYDYSASPQPALFLSGVYPTIGHIRTDADGKLLALYQSTHFTDLSGVGI